MKHQSSPLTADKNHRRCAWLPLLAALALALVPRAGQAASLPIPDGSFETPPVPDVAPFATPFIDYWQETPQPGYYNPTNFDNTPWQYLTGEFYNDPGDGAFIDNCSGNQCGFLQSLPLVGIYQDYNSFSGTQSGPTHAFNSKFKVGSSYALTVGLIGGGGGMPIGATLQMSLYYRDASNNMVTVASTIVTNTTALFPTNTHFVDVELDVPTVLATNAWAGKNIGIQFLCTVDFTTLGGYWDVDNVRLVENPIVIPNFSFETPAVPDVSPFATPFIDYWQQTAQPGYYDPSNFDNTPWQYLKGEFYNDPGDGAYIDNCLGNQCGFLQSLPLVGIFQDYNSFSDTQGGPTHAFNATFKPGNAYALTVALIGGGGGMPIGATLQMSLYYRDAASNMVTVASTFVTNTLALFPTNTHFVDCTLQMPGVKATDAWAGKNIGIQLLCAVDFTTYGGYWDVDNVRLGEGPGPALFVNPISVAGQRSVGLESAPGVAFNFLTATNITTPGSNWVSLGILTNSTGAIWLTDPTTNSAQRRFYRAKQL